MFINQYLIPFIYPKNELSYSFRYEVNDEYLKKQNINLKSMTKYGDINLSYLDQNSKTNNIINKDTETINNSLLSKKIAKFTPRSRIPSWTNRRTFWFFNRRCSRKISK